MTCSILFCQAPSFYDLAFVPDSVTAPYKPSNANYAYVRSKRGTEGLAKTSSADSVLSLNLPISKIVLVFTESSADAISNREEYNQERWENMLMTYPEFFQAKTTFKNVCQCTPDGDGEDYKHAQGFYIYFKSTEAPKKVEEPPVTKSEPPAKTKTAEEPAQTKKTETPTAKAETSAPKTEAPAAKHETKAPEPVAKEEPKKEVEAPVKAESNDEEVAEKPAKKKNDPSKPRRAKDTKVCRPACYGWGEDDLNQFFKDNIQLTKKQKRKWKKSTCEMRIQLNFDGTIKKSMIAGQNTDLNTKVTDAIKNMNPWNAAVKGGIAIKSEVKIALKFDKEWRVFKVSELVTSPKLPVKCKCAPDSEIFGE